MTNPLVKRVAEAMLDDPFIDDVPLMGTSQQDQRCEHYTRVAITAMREPTPEMLEAGREAFLKDMRDRRLLKWLFEQEPENVGPIGYVDRPIDLEVQHECATESTTKTWIAMIDAAINPQPTDNTTITTAREE